MDRAEETGRATNLSAEYGIIDAHVHIAPIAMMNPSTLALMRGQRGFESFQKLTEDPRALLRLMDQEGIERLVAINYVSPQVIGFTEEVNRWVVDYCRAEPERLLPCGSLDPRRTADPGGGIERLYE